MSKVAIWMGHSGPQVGATGIVVEDNVTRQAREWSVAYARACGHTVTTDNDNMSLVQRINASDSTHVGILEWHANSGGGTGTEVWYSKYDNGIGRKIAESMLSVTANYGFKSRGAKNSASNRYGRLGILDDTKPLALLVETMFVDTQDDVNDWNKNGKALVEAMTAKFLEGLGLKSTPSGKQPTQVSEAPKPNIKTKGEITMYAIYWVPNKNGKTNDAYYFNGVTFEYIGHPDSIKILKQIYKDNNGKDMPEYHWNNSAPWWNRLEQPTVNLQKLSDTVDKIAKKVGI